MNIIFISIIVFLALLVGTLWLRQVVLTWLETLLARGRWPARIILRAIGVPAVLWCLIVSAAVALRLFSISVAWEISSSRALWTTLVISMAITAANIALGFATFYRQKGRLSPLTTRVVRAVVLITTLGITVLFMWDIWGMPESPIGTAYNWLRDNWPAILIPLVVFIASMIAVLRIRRMVYTRAQRWLDRKGWSQEKVIHGLRVPSLIWCITISAYLALAVSALPPESKMTTSKVLGSFMLISITFALISIINNLLITNGHEAQMPGYALSLLKNVTRIVFLVIISLMILDIWDIPTTPLLLLIALASVAAILAFRDAVPNFFAGLQLSATRQVKVGDFIKLHTGEEGYIVDISWNTTRIKSLDESIVLMPNSRLIQSTVVNYGHPLKKATEPFRFNTRTHLTELTGLQARNLNELVDVLRKMPDSVVYFHTHRFLEERHYITPELSNDFAVWVSDALGDDVLGETLASVDIFAFPNLSLLRDRLVAIIEGHLSAGGDGRVAMEGREFYFMKAVGVILPTPYVAYDLREFVEALRKISLGSLYFHIFDARLRLGRELNDFSMWLEKSLSEAELGTEIARLDPYTYTLEGLRLALIQTIEKRIK